MKQIIKTASPNQFEAWKIKKRFTRDDLIKKSQLNSQRGEIWKTFTKKTEIKNLVKESLLNEQGYICCYCQQSIKLNEQSIIEHFIARATDATKMFDYDNLFACCDGGQKERTEQNSDEENNQHIEVIPKYCGHARGNIEVLINPLDINCETHFAYEFIESPDDKPEVSIKELSDSGKQAIQVLNLDNKVLRKMRGEFIAGFIDGISIEEIEELLPQIKQKNEDGKFQPFCAVLEYVLKNL
jgi:uncharacterized protein (TIGR02646 family)